MTMDPRRLQTFGQGPDGHHRRPLGLAGAEAILKLRAIKANGDFDTYWDYHLAQERHHVHEARYHDHAIPSVT